MPLATAHIAHLRSKFNHVFAMVLGALIFISLILIQLCKKIAKLVLKLPKQLFLRFWQLIDHRYTSYDITLFCEICLIPPMTL